MRAKRKNQIEVVYFDDKPVVYKNGERLTEKEIVDLLVSFMEDCDILITKNEQLKIHLNNVRSQRDESRRDARENATRVGELEKEKEELKDRIKEVLKKELIKADTEFVPDEVLRTFFRERAVVVRIANELKVDLNE